VATEVLAVDVATDPGDGPGVQLDVDGLAGEARAWIEKA
jgi:hypothetical protein